MKYDVFISYKSQYIDVVKAVCHILEEENIRCWFAPRDLDKTNAGKNYDDVIVDTINNCRMVIVILSNEALESEWVQMEINQAQKKKKFIIPYVVTELTRENGLRMRLENKHWIDAFPNPERKFSLLLSNVKLLLNQTLTKEGGKEKLYDVDNDTDFETDFDYEEGVVLYKAKEYNDAIVAFLSSAERGNPKAKTMLCQIFYDLDTQIEIIDKEIWDITERQAKAGHCYANFIMHTRYYKDYSNFFISFEYLKKAVRNNCISLAFLRLGIHYGWGMGVKQNHTLAMHYYQKALAMGCDQAFSYIAQEFVNGSDKQKPDEAAALEYYQKGVAKNDRRSILQLAKNYAWGGLGSKDIEKAKELSQKAIDLGDDDGYNSMGDAYYSLYMDDCNNEDAEKEAVKWYKKAVQRDVFKAFGSLAIFYWQNNEFEEAYRWAKRGRIARNGESAFYLGFFYEMDDKYEEAWKCYFDRYKWYGVGADSLGKLFVEHGYKPEEVKIEELAQMLEIQARNSDKDALKYLTTIYTDDKYGMKNKQKEAECVKLGASLGYPEQMYNYGLSFMGEDELKSNPYKGLQWIESAAYKEYIPAVTTLIQQYNSGIYEDRDKFKEWGEFAITHNMCHEEILPLLLRFGENFDDPEVFKSFLLSALDSSIKDETLVARITAKLLHHHFENKWTLDEPSLKRCLDKVNSYRENFGYHTYFKDIFSHIYPGFNAQAVDNYKVKNADWFNDYYTYFRAINTEIDVEEQDCILEQLYQPVKQDSSYEESLKYTFQQIMNIASFWDNDYNNFVDSYHNLCTKYELEPEIIPPLEKTKLMPYFPSTLAQYYNMQSLRCFLSLSSCEAFEKLRTLKDDEEILDYAEQESDVDLQLFLIEYVELHIELDAIITKNYSIYCAYKKGNTEILIEALNQYRNRLNELNLENGLPEFTEDNLPEISLSKRPKKSDSLISDATEESENDSDDEFDRLLAEFLNNE